MFGCNSIDWRKNPPIWWVLERANEGHNNAIIVYETMDEDEARRKAQELGDQNDDCVYRVESRTEK